MVDLADFGPIRADGRTPRWLRWIGGVAVVSDGARAVRHARRRGGARVDVRDPAAGARVADGPFAEVAWERGIEVVALAGLDRPGLAVAGRAGRPGHRRPAAHRPAGAGLPRDRGPIVAAVGGRPDLDLTPPTPPPDAEV